MDVFWSVSITIFNLRRVHLGGGGLCAPFSFAFASAQIVVIFRSAGFTCILRSCLFLERNYNGSGEDPAH